ncbi:MAG: hypothetical protein KF833_21495 [Verrucomicrobiae bacterium]|nr:hypothetical protein [Verrucomicrobiae bacterium]
MVFPPACGSHRDPFNGWGHTFRSHRILCWLLMVGVSIEAAAQSAPPGRLLRWGRGVVPYLEPAQRYVEIACATEHVVALRSDGHIDAWGSDLEWRERTAVRESVTNAIAVAAGDGFGAALRRDGTVVTWGQPFRSVAVPAGLADVTAISAGRQHVLALRRNGTVVGWGNGADGRFAFPDGMSQVVSVAGGGRHSVVAFSDGTVGSWGYNSSGQVAAQVGLGGVLGVSAGNAHSVALVEGGSIWQWGNGAPGFPRVTGVQAVVAAMDTTYALTSDGRIIDRLNLNGLPGLTNIARLASGMRPEFAIDTEGGLVCWGGNRSGVNEYRLATNSFVAVASFGASAGDIWESHTLAITVSGEVVGSYSGAAYIDAGLVRPIPGTLAIAVAPGPDYGLALKPDGTVVSWALPASRPNVPVPEGLEGVVAIAAGGDHRLALKAEGTVVGWGRETGFAALPPTGLSNVVAIAAGLFHGVALKRDGTVEEWSRWGRFPRILPPPEATNIVAIAAGDDHTLALRDDGRVIGWGWVSAPALRIPEDLNDVVAIATSGTHALGLKSDGSVVRWGDRGDGGGARIPSYVRDIVAIAAGTYDDYAIRAIPARIEVERSPHPRLSFQTFKGREYAVTYSDAVPGGGWSKLRGTRWPGTGQILTIEDPTLPLPPARFYRLAEYPQRREFDPIAE